MYKGAAGDLPCHASSDRRIDEYWSKNQKLLRYLEISVHAPKIAMKRDDNDDTARHTKRRAGSQGRHRSLRLALTPKTFCTRES